VISTVRAENPRINAAFWCTPVDLCGEGGNLSLNGWPRHQLEKADSIFHSNSSNGLLPAGIYSFISIYLRE
jgi:hypothetical protein